MQTTPRRIHPLLIIAALAGLVHAGLSLYWALGGNWLLSTIGTELVQAFEGRRWLLIPVALVKAGFALFPVALTTFGLLNRRWARTVCWLGAVILIAWGGVNTTVCNLVLAGLVGGPGYDRMAMIGHAWLWDPLFVIWGASLVAGLMLGRRTSRR